MSRIMTLPKIGVNMTEAVVDEWFVKPGDVVKEGDAIFLAETDKATQEIFATVSGIVGKLLAQQGDTVEIHQPIMLLLDEGEQLDDEAAGKQAVEQEKASEQAPAEEKIFIAKAQTPPAAISTGSRVRISPLAKKIAKEKGIDIADLQPSQVGKRIMKADVLGFKPSEAEPIARRSAVLDISDDDILETLPLSGIRKVIASRMSQSNLEKPCAALTLTVCADEMIVLRDRFKQNDIKVGYNDILVRIVAQSLSEHRNINSVLIGDRIQLLRHVNIGVAVDSDRGLLVPVIKDADKKSIQQIARDFAEKVEAIRRNTIDTDNLSGGTFTITNLGMFEIEQFVPIINPPECCILAVGALKKEFIPDDMGKPKLVSTMKLTLVFDHRIVDGAPAAKFLQRIKQYVECPELLL